METPNDSISGSGLCGAPSPVRPARTSSTGQVEGVEPGDLARMHDFGAQGYLAIRLPNDRILTLNGQLVRVLDVTKAPLGRELVRMVKFRPEPWEFAEDAWPGSWEATETYFRRVDEPER
jgi:hypothetical protein